MVASYARSDLICEPEGGEGHPREVSAGLCGQWAGDWYARHIQGALMEHGAVSGSAKGENTWFEKESQKPHGQLVVKREPRRGNTVLWIQVH